MRDTYVNCIAWGERGAALSSYVLYLDEAGVEVPLSFVSNVLITWEIEDSLCST